MIFIIEIYQSCIGHESKFYINKLKQIPNTQKLIILSDHLYPGLINIRPDMSHIPHSC